MKKIRDDYVLKFISGPLAGLDYNLDSDLVIGRSEECDVSICDLTVSRKHCMIFFKNGYPYIKDMGASNGTMIKGDRIVMKLLQPGDEVRIGDVVFVLSSVKYGDIRPVKSTVRLRLLPPMDEHDKAVVQELKKRHYADTTICHAPKLLSVRFDNIPLKDQNKIEEWKKSLAAMINNGAEEDCCDYNDKVSRWFSNFFNVVARKWRNMINI